MGKTLAFQIKLERKANYVSLYVKAPALDRIFQQWSYGRTRKTQLQERYGHNAPPALLERPDGTLYDVEDYYTLATNAPEIPGVTWSTIATLPYDGEAFNLQYLATPKIADGVTYRLAMPLSNDAIKEIRATLKTAIPKIIEAYGRPITAILSITEEDPPAPIPCVVNVTPDAA